MKIALSLVTYNRLPLLKKAINDINQHAKGISELIIVDNNSNDGTLEYLKESYNFICTDENFNTDICKSELFNGYCKVLNIPVVLISLKQNTGGSGGFYESVKFFYEQSVADWYWGMDDDAFIKKNALSELMKAINLNNDKTQAFWSNCNNDKDFSGNYKLVKSWMFVGFCINKELIRKVGLPKNDYFIYHDDSEYAERIIRSGFDILKIKNSYIEHGDLSSRPVWKKKFLNKTYEFPMMPDWKLYYYFRNDILKSGYSRKSKLIKMVKVTISILKLSIINWKVLKVALIALIHGVINKRGMVYKP